jgi:uncharacterized membrane protein
MFFLFWVPFLFVAGVVFLIMVAVRHKSKFFLKRMGQFGLALVAAIALVAIIRQSSESQAPLAIQLVVMAFVALTGGVLFSRSLFESDEHWKKRMERKLANRVRIKIVPNDRYRFGNKLK